MSTSSAPNNEFCGDFLAATDGEVPPGARAPGGTSPSVTNSVRGDNYPNTGGFTKDLKLRFEHHSKGQVDSTKNRRPLRLIYYEACMTQKDATNREKYLKTYNGKRFLHKRLKSYLTG